MDRAKKPPMIVATRMTRNPITITPTESLATAQEKMRAGEFRHLPVVEGERLVGILSDRDLRIHWGHFKETRVTGAMTDDPETAAPTSTVAEAAERMLGRKLDSLPVVEDGRLVGIITLSDVLKAYLELSATSAERKGDQC
jgi:acetoin utilization protein AcuB